MANETDISITVTAFGKHPAWADHIDNLPAPGPCLPLFKSMFYTNGIDPNVRKWSRPIDEDDLDDVRSPAVDSHLEEPQHNLIRFDHRFRFWSPDALILGTLIPSSDSKGRKKYPLVLAAQCTRDNASWLSAHVWPALDRLKEDCPAAESVDDVKALLSGATQRLQSEFDTDPEATGGSQIGSLAPVGVDAIETLATYFVRDTPAPQPEVIAENDEPELSAEPEVPGESAGDESSHGPDDLAQATPQAPEHADHPVEVVRLLYQIQRLTRTSDKPENWGGAHIRLPRLSDDTLADMTLYQNVARHMTDNKATILTVAPTGQGWIDLVIGSPDASGYLFLRRSDLPLCTDIAYNLDGDELRSIYSIIEGASPTMMTKDTPSGIFTLGKAAMRGAGMDLSEKSASSASSIKEKPSTSSPRKSGDKTIQYMLIGIGALIVVIVVLMAILMG